MDFKLNIPIYLQVIEDIKSKIISKEVQMGEKLPSSRDLALTYNINPNTAARVYTEMERMGIAYIKRGIGTFVVEDDDLIQKMKKEKLEEAVRDFIKKISDLGYSPKEIWNEVENYNGEE